jgi:nitroreductase
MTVTSTSQGFDLETVDKLLSTTRAVRRRLDLERSVERNVILDCIRLSQQAPTGSNAQTWRWLVVTEPHKRRALAEIYRRGRPAIEASLSALQGESAQTDRVYEAALWLCENLEKVPVLVIPCVEGRPPDQFQPVLHATVYGSILPAIWSFQLALRSRGLGSVLTTLHLLFEGEVRTLFEIPDDVLQVALLPVAHTLGSDFRPAHRPPPEHITYWDTWGAATGHSE